MLLKNLSWIGKIVKFYEMLLKKLHFGRSGKNFGRPEQFWKVWKKIRNVREKISEKNVCKNIQGVKNYGNEGEGRFREILSCPPRKCVLPLKCPPKFRDPSHCVHTFCVLFHIPSGWIKQSFSNVLAAYLFRFGISKVREIIFKSYRIVCRLGEVEALLDLHRCFEHSLVKPSRVYVVIGVTDV